MKRKYATKSLANILSLAVSPVMLPSGFTTASASSGRHFAAMQKM